MAELQADTSADLDGRKTSTLSCLRLDTLSGSSDWRIQLDPLLMRWSMHRYGEHRVPKYPLGLMEKGPTGQGLEPCLETMWELSQLRCTSHRPASFHPILCNSPLQICPFSTQVLGTRDQIPSLLQEAANNPH